MDKGIQAAQHVAPAEGVSLYSQAFDALPMGIVFQDAKGAITQANPAAQRILGLSFDQMCGVTSVDPLWQTVREDGSPFPGAEHPAMVTLRTGKPVVDVRMGVRNPQREAKTWISVKSFPAFNETTGAVQGVCTLFEDITHSVNAERDLARQEKRFSALIAATPVGVFETDALGAVTFVNSRWEEIAGMRAEAAIGKGWETAVHPEDKRRLCAEWAAAVMSVLPIRIKFRFRHANGKVVWVIGQAVRLAATDRQAEGYVGTVTDITDLKVAEDELTNYREHLEGLVRERTAELTLAKENAEAANHAKTAFLANVSHELRTPLHGIIGMTSLAQTRTTDPAQRETLDAVMRAARHLGVLITDLLDISRIETRRFALAEEFFELGEVLDTPTNISRRAASEKGLRFEVDVDPALATAPFRGDASRLRQVLLNLTSNAVKFTTTGEIRVKATLAEDGAANVLLRFEVTDSGSGIAAADQARLFGMFEHAREHPGNQQVGAGLGLDLSRRLAEAMGGSIGVESVVGKGSMFWFTARVRKERARPHAATAANRAGAAREALQIGHSGKRLLIVDDNEDNRALLQAQLRPVWKSIDVAMDGSEALDKVSQRRYDLILMDMRMPRMDGLEATRRIRQLPGWAGVPIVAMTANVYPEDRERCLAAGMNDFIPKAVSAEAPFEMILKWLEPPG